MALHLGADLVHWDVGIRFAVLRIRGWERTMSIELAFRTAIANEVSLPSMIHPRLLSAGIVQ